MQIDLLGSFWLFSVFFIFDLLKLDFDLSERRLNNTDLITVLEAILTAS